MKKDKIMKHWQRLQKEKKIEKQKENAYFNEMDKAMKAFGLYR